MTPRSALSGPLRGGTWRGVRATEDRATGGTEPSIVVPWRCTVLVPAPIEGATKIDRLLALARFSQNRTGAIGFDALPANPRPLNRRAANPVRPAATFANALAALSHFDRVAAISHASATKFRGWRRMLGGAGIEGPDIAAIALPIVGPTGPDASQRSRSDHVATVLVVGTGNGAQNHAAVLAAAEALWSDGVRFRLDMVRPDHTAATTRAIERLKGLGRDLGRLRQSERGGPR